MRQIDADELIETIDCSADLGGVLGKVVECVKLYAKHMVATAPTINTWISCDEQLPESEEKTYWICTDTEYQCQCRWTNVNHFWTDLTTDWHWNIFDYPQYSKVVAWMPLPEPWKGEADEQVH